MGIESAVMFALANKDEIQAIVDKILFVGRSLVETRMARNEVNDLIAEAIANAETLEEAQENLDMLYANAKAFSNEQWEEAKRLNPLLG